MAPGTLRLVVAATLVVFMVAAFWPSLSGGLVAWDDDRNFIDNRAFRGLGWQELKWALTTFHVGVYQPLAWILLELQYSAWGLNPRGYHAVSLLLHIANALLLFGLLRELLEESDPANYGRTETSQILAAGAATLLMMVHPLRTEAVAWASCQPYLPALLFSILAVRAQLRRRKIWTWTFAVAAMACKPVAATLPVLLLILDVYPGRRLGGDRGWWKGAAARRVWLEKAPLLVAAVIFAIIAERAKASAQALVPFGNDGLARRVAQAGYATVFYVGKTLWPFDLSPYYPRPDDLGLGRPLFALAATAVVAVSVGAVLARRRWPAFLAGWAAYLVILAPNSGLARISEQIAADRYAYVASVPLMVALAALLWRPLSRTRDRLVQLATLVVVLLAATGLAMASRRQCGVWNSTGALWTYSFRLGGDRDSGLQNNYGALLMDSGRVEESLEHFERAIQLVPMNADAHRNRAAALYTLKRFKDALPDALVAARLAPDNPAAHLTAGAIWFELHNPDEGIRHVRAYLEQREDLSARLKLADVLLSLGRAAEAVPVLEQAALVNPYRPYVRTQLGWAQFKAGHNQEAQIELGRSISLNSKDAVPLYYLGEVLLASGNPRNSVQRFEQALAINPRMPEAQDGLARAHAALGAPVK